MPSSNIVHKIESLVPSNVVACYREKKWQLLRKKWSYDYTKIIRRIQARKGLINVLFLLKMT